MLIMLTLVIGADHDAGAGKLVLVQHLLLTMPSPATMVLGWPPQLS